MFGSWIVQYHHQQQLADLRSFLDLKTLHSIRWIWFVRQWVIVDLLHHLRGQL
jgi:hypothetical protein